MKTTMTPVTFGTHFYLIISAGNLFGVCRGYGQKVKYLPVMWDVSAHIARPLRTRIKFSGTAEDLQESLELCSRIKADAGRCAALCEQVLATGRTTR